MSTAPRRLTIAGKPALVTFLDDDFHPVEPEQATRAKAIFEDGTRAFYVVAPKGQRRPEDEA